MRQACASNFTRIYAERVVQSTSGQPVRRRKQAIEADWTGPLICEDIPQACSADLRAAGAGIASGSVQAMTKLWSQGVRRLSLDLRPQCSALFCSCVRRTRQSSCASFAALRQMQQVVPCSVRPTQVSMLQIFCFALHVTPLAGGGLFVAREVEVLERLAAGSDKPLSALSTHAEIATLAVAPNAPANEAFPTLTELLQKFAALLKDAGKLQPDMPLARMTRDVAQSKVRIALRV